jgi:putative methionine-R-sulfoxide reductase with GAF domain
MLDVSTMWRSIVIGSIILLAVFFDVERRRVRQSASRARVKQVIADSTYLEGIVSKIGQLIRNQFGSPYVRVYLTDPKLDELIECRADNSQVAAQAGSIAEQVKTSGRAVILDDLGTGPSNRVQPLDPNIQSAMAVPLSLNGQMVGVLEVQSLAPHGFVPETTKRLTELLQEVIAPLRDAWLLECGWLASQTRNALRHLWDEVYLGRCALAEWSFPGFDYSSEGGPVARGVRLRRLLLEAIDNLKPKDSSGGSRPADRRYDTLYLTYLEDLTVDEVIKRLTVSRRQYFYDLKDAVGTLAHLLVRTHQAE